MASAYLSEKIVVLGLVLFVSACAPASHNGRVKAGQGANAEKYASKRGELLQGGAIASTNNVCVDHFNFIKEGHEQNYTGYSKEYTKISDGYRFLNVNKNIMDKDARDIYTMSLDMKLNTLCTKVQYSGYSLIREKIKALSAV